MLSADIWVDSSPEQKIFRSLRDAIARNQIAAGATMTSEQVSGEFDSPQHIVDGAFLLLENHALATRDVPGQVTTLPISVHHLHVTCFLREQAEAEIIRRVTRNADTNFLNELREQIVRQKIVGLRSPVDLLRLDDRFHRALASKAGFDKIWPQIESWKLCTDRVRFTIAESLDPEMMVSQHSAIVDRMAVRDAEGAAAAARYHLSGVLRQVPEYRITHPECFAD